MAHFRRETTVAAPLDEVWRFYSSIEGLTAVTPDWVGLRVDSVTGPEGERSATVLEEGTTVRLSVRPLGGPRCAWTSEIRRRERRDGWAVLADEMVEGPLDRWVHTHQFERVGGGTRIVDDVEYEFSTGPLGRTVSPMAVVGLDPMFRYRHRRTHELLE